MLDVQALRLNYSLRRYYVDDYMQRQVGQLPSGTYALDLGGHKLAKRGRFDINRYPIKTVCLNVMTDNLPDIQADGAWLPLAPMSFDAVICTEVLEHVPDPRLLIVESHRVLRRGGKLIATVPFLYRMHADPYDFGRYTDYYWRKVLDANGFTDIEIKRHGLFYSVALDFFKQYMSKVYPGTLFGTIIRRLALLAIVAPLHPLVLWWEQQPQPRNNQFLSSYTTGFGIVATKA